MAAPKKGRSASAQSKPWRSLALILIAIAALTGGMFASGDTTPRLGIDLAGGTSITLKAVNEPGKPNAINKANMKTAVGIIERRVNGLGVSEAEVQTQGNENIVVNIPRGTNEKQARDQVGTTAKLFFRPVITGQPAPAQKSASPSSSPSSPGGTGSGKSTEPSAPATSTASSPAGSTSPSPSETKQGRSLSGGLLAADDKASSSPSPSTSGSSSPSPSTSAPAPSTTDASAGLEAQLAALDCSTPEARAAASEKARAAKETDSIVACDPRAQYKYALGPVAVKGERIKSADAVFDTQAAQGWIVQMDFDGTGAKQFADVTGELAAKAPPQNQFAIVLDGEIASAPSLSGAITGGSAQITGGFTEQTARDLANMLSYGALPLSFQEQSVTTVTAALGGEQLRAGLIAGAIGLALVIIYLVTYYRGLSFIAIFSLLVSAILTYVIMSLLGPAIGFALNLPAVCGAIVAIGITADSFIVYFERIRDEIREGRTLRPAVERAWPRARRTILVSDFVSFLAAAVLFIVTVGKVQGFAFTLGLTTVLDVVVVFLFTKPLMTILARRKFFADGHKWSGLDPKSLGAKPPLRRTRRPAGPVAGPAETKEA
ncbi:MULTISPECIES: protein translocase subunit SecD [unclassified Streptomyces]|uniref:protein translocase subunit SecD n=1 Tax=unclassified Streptomyces TaxID=2593676 RepID=UPI001F0353D3|nr:MULTISPECIES: protein translocase subunit SecD [unclassified Streptomyces]MCH0565652.1 protein translocase subunit SecD [Streptomyces sp. MUM 2J]MCH0569175.1 protein translocase subunit SecD [Streptomyces sp. MUM 136J]